jgi:membrane-anchored glycerophosphoryl diester phosphodiesterase (GDPDase)
VWRLIGSHVLVMLLAWGAMALIGGSIAAISFGLSKVSQGAQVTATVILVILAYLWFIYAAVRLVFFIPAVVVAENHIGIRRAWHLGKGNFWRIVGIYLVVTLPLGMAVNTVASSLLQMAMGQDGMVMTNPADAQKLFLVMFHALGRIWPYYLVLQFIAMVLQAGLLSGAIANAYSLVTGGSEIAPPPSKVPA